MNMNRLTLAGHPGKSARKGATQSGRTVTKLSIATSKRYKDADGNWQWHSCVCYDTTADHAAKIQTVSHVFLEQGRDQGRTGIGTRAAASGLPNSSIMCGIPVQCINDDPVNRSVERLESADCLLQARFRTKASTYFGSYSARERREMRRQS